MGLIKGILNNGVFTAAGAAVTTAMGDQWKEYFYCDSLADDVLMIKGQKRVSSKSANKNGSDNIISNGSLIAVNEGQCMIIVEQGKIVEVCAEPGEFVYDTSTEPSIFAGKLGKSILDTFKLIGKRFTFGGDVAKDQRVYYFNTKEILDNKFGTQSPIFFKVVDSKINYDVDVQIRCSGVYTYKIANPLLFYTSIAGNVADMYKKENLEGTMKTEFVSALQPAFGAMSALELRPSDIPNHTNELRDAVQEQLSKEWGEGRGIEVVKISLNPITLSDDDMKRLQDAQDEARYQNQGLAAAGLAKAKMQAMKDAANNSAGAMTGFMGMGFAGAQVNNNDLAAFYQQADQQKAAQAVSQAPADGWTCACGAVNTGNFCPTCGAKKPEDPATWTCACGAVNNGNFCPTCGAKKPAEAPKACSNCGYVFDDQANVPNFCPKCGNKIVK